MVFSLHLLYFFARAAAREENSSTVDMSDFVEYVALTNQIAVNENTLGRMKTKLENHKKKVRKYRKKLRKRAARYDSVVQRLQDVTDNLLKLDKWKVANLEEIEAAEKPDDEHDWKGREIILLD